MADANYNNLTRNEILYSNVSDKPDWIALQIEANDRVEECRYQKVLHELDLREGYYFTAPQRARNISSRVETIRSKPQDAQILYTSFGFELVEDFATVIQNTFLPESERWCIRRAGNDIPLELRDEVNKQAEDGDKVVFEAIANSNFYPECGKLFKPDLALGTVAMWIDDTRVGQPINCQAIPLRELEINVGPYGEVDDRFVIRHTRYRAAKGMLRGIPLPPEVQKRMDDIKYAREKVEIRWGFWRDWTDESDVVWQHVVLVNKVLVKAVKLRGAGSCPVVIGRWNPFPEWPFGIGPLIQGLPSLRELDELVSAKIENLEINLRPPIAYPDDSFANIEEGIECGMAYPVRPGSEGAIKHLYEANPPDAAIYDRQNLEQSLKRLFHLDWPQQTGDTPPTATQWLDQMTMAQRRIGTPGQTFWKEFPAEVFLRFLQLLTRKGAIQPVEVDGKKIALAPYNPAQRAAEQQEVAMASRFVEIAGQAFPEEFKIWVDGQATMTVLAKKLGSNRIIQFRKPDQVQTALSQIKQLLSGQAPGAPAVPDQGGAPVQDLAGPAPAPTQVEIRGRM